MKRLDFYVNKEYHLKNLTVGAFTLNVSSEYESVPLTKLTGYAKIVNGNYNVLVDFDNEGKFILSVVNPKSITLESDLLLFSILLYLENTNLQSNNMDIECDVRPPKRKYNNSEQEVSSPLLVDNYVNNTDSNEITDVKRPKSSSSVEGEI